MLNLKFPEVKRFGRAALAHVEAARKLLELCPEQGRSTFGHDAVYLSGYVVECSLKALLLSQYPRARHVELLAWFKEKLKHNLELLKVELKKRRVRFPPEQSTNLARVGQWWSTEMRYDVRGWTLKDSERVFRAAEALFNWVWGA